MCITTFAPHCTKLQYNPHPTKLTLLTCRFKSSTKPVFHLDLLTMGVSEMLGMESMLGDVQRMDKRQVRVAGWSTFGDMEL